MRNFCLFVSLILLCFPWGSADALNYFADADYEFCTYETPQSELDAVSNGLFWEVRASATDKDAVFSKLEDVKAVSITVQNFDRDTFFRDFRVTILSEQILPDVTILYCASGTIPGQRLQIAIRSDLVKIGIPVLLNSY